MQGLSELVELLYDVSGAQLQFAPQSDPGVFADGAWCADITQGRHITIVRMPPEIADGVIVVEHVRGMSTILQRMLDLEVYPIVMSSTVNHHLHYYRFELNLSDSQIEDMLTALSDCMYGDKFPIINPIFNAMFGSDTNRWIVLCESPGWQDRSYMENFYMEDVFTDMDKYHDIINRYFDASLRDRPTSCVKFYDEPPHDVDLLAAFTSPIEFYHILCQPGCRIDVNKGFQVNHSLPSSIVVPYHDGYHSDSGMEEVLNAHLGR